MIHVARLETDQTISVGPPTPPDTFPPGQPAVLLSKTVTLGTTRVLITASFSVSVSGPLDPQSANEWAPLLQLSLWCDGTEIPFARTTINPYAPTPDPGPPQLQSLNVGGSLAGIVDVPVGEHVFDLRWGLQGKVPNANAWCLPEGTMLGGRYDHAVLRIEAICAP